MFYLHFEGMFLVSFYLIEPYEQFGTNLIKVKHLGVYLYLL